MQEATGTKATTKAKTAATKKAPAKAASTGTRKVRFSGYRRRLSATIADVWGNLSFTVYAQVNMKPNHTCIAVIDDVV